MQTNFSGKSENVIDAVNIYFQTDCQPKLSNITTGEILVKFFKYYAFEFDPKTNAVDISQIIDG